MPESPARRTPMPQKQYLQTFASRALAPIAAMALLTAGCAAPPPDKPAAEPTVALALLNPASGTQANGIVRFRQEGELVRVKARVSGLQPNREHGFHVHEKGDCSAPDASSAGEHLNPQGRRHGPPNGGERHAGDLPSLKSDAAGVAEMSFDVKGTLLGAGASDFIGKALVVHANPDDYTTQPSGNAGTRIACGVIAVPVRPGGVGGNAPEAKTIPKQM